MLNRAVCIRCGYYKAGALDKCPRCGFQPVSPDEQAKSLVLSPAADVGGTSIGRSAEELSDIAMQIESGTPYAFSSVELGAVARAQGLAKARSPSALQGLEKVFIGGMLVVLAAVPWSFRDRISQQFASSYLATIDVRTTTERNDKRVERAFAATKAATSLDATIQYPEGNPKLIRKSAVRVRGATRDDALFAARKFSSAMESAFNGEGTGTLDNYVRAWVEPVDGDTSLAVRQGINWGAGIIGLLALAVLVAGWRDNRRQQPDARIFELPATLALVVFAFTIGPLLLTGWLFMGLFAMAILLAIGAKAVASRRREP